ncbi:MAG: 6-phosphogluconolactonase [Phycisphaerales bacterium]|nr:6-phosphogluconolactonase [Phycisphaerales bacterium]
MVEPSTDSLLDRIATDLMLAAIEAVRLRGAFHLAVTSDERVQPLLERLMLDPGLRGMPWPNTHVWQADEECDKRGEAPDGWSRISGTLVPHAGIGRGQVHPMPTWDESAPAHYGNRLKRVLRSGHLDHAVLCVASDGCLGGIVPDTVYSDDPVTFVHRGEADVLTMTPSLLGRASRVVCLVLDDDARRSIDRGIVQEGTPVHRLMRAGMDPLWGITAEALD